MKKFIVILVFAAVLTFLIGCGEEEVAQLNELQQIGGVYVVPKTQKPYSGKFVTTHENNVIKETGSLKNGKRHGEIKTYSEDGSIDKVETFADGVLELVLQAGKKDEPDAQQNPDDLETEDISEDKNEASKNQANNKAQPNDQNRGVLKMITAKSSKSNFSAYNLMKDKNAAKEDSARRKVAGLQTSGKTELGGRRGTATGGFNDGYAEKVAPSSSSGIGDMLANLQVGSGVKARGSLKAQPEAKEPQARDIDMGSGDGGRPNQEIMQVVNARMPGLRNIYNKYLKLRRGFSGKVILKFTIAPGGDIISISIVSSTTGYPEFDNAVKNMVGTWKWKAIKSGNTTPTIPFNFTE